MCTGVTSLALQYYCAVNITAGKAVQGWGCPGVQLCMCTACRYCQGCEPLSLCAEAALKLRSTCCGLIPRPAYESKKGVGLFVKAVLPGGAGTTHMASSVWQYHQHGLGVVLQDVHPRRVSC